MCRTLFCIVWFVIIPKVSPSREAINGRQSNEVPGEPSNETTNSRLSLRKNLNVCCEQARVNAISPGTTRQSSISKRSDVSTARPELSKARPTFFYNNSENRKPAISWIYIILLGDCVKFGRDAWASASFGKVGEFDMGCWNESTRHCQIQTSFGMKYSRSVLIWFSVTLRIKVQTGSSQQISAFCNSTRFNFIQYVSSPPPHQPNLHDASSVDNDVSPTC